MAQPESGWVLDFQYGILTLCKRAWPSRYNVLSVPLLLLLFNVVAWTKNKRTKRQGKVGRLTVFFLLQLSGADYAYNVMVPHDMGSALIHGKFL